MSVEISEESKVQGSVHAVRVPFGANEIRLDWRQWLAVLVLVAAFIVLLPSVWLLWESIPFEKGFRVPYESSKDYWLYSKWLDYADSEDSIYLVGDSVVWGEYVSADGTLSAFLNEHSESEHEFVNAGVNGLFPLALEGLVTHYGQRMTNRRVLLHCNLLWMTSPEADLSSEKEQRFNHPNLVAQFRPKIPCYRASYDERLGIAIRRSVPFFGFVGHLQNTYFDQKGLYQWTLADDGEYPPSYPNTYRLPWTAIDFAVSGEPENDPDRGLGSARHKAWSTTGEGTQQFDWVALDRSLQWAAFQRLMQRLLSRGNDVLIVVGPLNRFIMAPENQTLFDARVLEVTSWLAEQGVPSIVPEALPFDLYGDASHPLTAGYRLLAERLWASPEFQRWLSKSEESALVK